MNNEIALEVDHLSIDYIPFKKMSIQKSFLKKQEPKDIVHAVIDLSFSMKEGEILGIVGKNGSGKSTLLRSIAGIFQPDKGTVDLKGHSVSLLAIGVGFDKNLTGRENIILSGTLMGFSEDEIRAHMDDIIAFSELGKFIDYPVRTYSSGMYSKLAFSITSSLETDIILIDEILSVGDERFKKKSYKRMKELINDEKHTVLIVAHNSQTIRELCTKVLWIDDGNMVMMGEPDEVISAYQEFMDSDAAKATTLKKPNKSINKMTHVIKEPTTTELPPQTKPEKRVPNNPESKKERSPYWDNARAALMFLVVLGHMAESACGSSVLCRALFVCVYCFHMPAFLFIAGLFHTNKNIPKKAACYFSAYLISKIIFFLSRTVFGATPAFKLLSESGLPWFMFAMAVFILLGYFLRDIPPILVLSASFIAGCFSGYDSSIGDFLVLSRIIVYFPFYYLGMLCERDKIEAIAKKPRAKLIGSIIVILWAASCLLFTDKIYLLRPVFTGRNAFSEGMLSYGFLIRIITYSITLAVGAGFLLMIPTRKLGIITVWGSRTLQVYLWHMVIKNILTGLGLYKNVFSQNRITLLIWLLLTIPIYIISSLPFLSFPMKQIMAPARTK